MPVIELKNLSKIYRTQLIETHALNNISLSVAPGEFISLSGPSGSGKTTLLNVLGLLDAFEKGSYHFDSQSVAGASDAILSKIRNEKIGFVFQAFNLMPDLNVRDNVELPLYYRRVSATQRRKAAEAALERVGLSSRTRHLPAQLSGGQQQRVAIARAIVGHPKILLADEPTGNLDSARAHDIMALLETLNEQGTTIVMVTHSPECAARASRRLHILDGQLTDLRDVEDTNPADTSTSAKFQYTSEGVRA